MEDLNKLLAWKSALVYIVALVCFLALVFTFFISPVFAIIFGSLTIILMLYNMIMVIKSNQGKAVKIALMIPKIIFFIIFFLLTIALMISSFY